MTESYDKAMSQAMGYLGIQARTARQMEDYLLKKQHDERIIAQVMARLTEYGYIDDRRYAQRYVETHKDRGGKSLLRCKMMQKGLDRAAIDEALAGLPREDQVSAARALLQKKMQGDERPDARRRAMQAALRRGFSYDVVRAAADECEEEETWDE